MNTLMTTDINSNINWRKPLTELLINPVCFRLLELMYHLIKRINLNFKVHSINPSQVDCLLAFKTIFKKLDIAQR